MKLKKKPIKISMKKYLKIIKENSSGFNNFFKTSILSLVLIFAFFFLPSTFDFFSQTNKDSNTIEQLFKNTKNDLKEIRKTKLVNIGNSIDRLPKQIKNIENVKERKKLFIQIVLPLIIEENIKIRLDRKKLFSILNKNNNSTIEKKWLDNKFKQYGVKGNDLSDLKIRMDEIPVSLAIAQAAKETGWGTSRFALDGNALFGQWTFTGEGIKPAGAVSNTKHKVMKFKVLQASVRAYFGNLNTHSSYRKFRKLRATARDNNEKLNSLILADYLDAYAATGAKYTKILKQIIKQNSLTEFDDVNILTTSSKLRSLI
jgi:Bax protein